MSSTYISLTGNDTIHVKSNLPSHLKYIKPTKDTSWESDKNCLTPRNDDKNLQPLKINHIKKDSIARRARTKSI